jgi:HEAT repeat protein
VFFLPAAFGLGFVWWQRQKRFSGVEFRFLPQPCRLVAAINVKGLQNSPVFQHWKERQGIGPEEEAEWTGRFGLAIDQISEIYVAGDLQTPSRLLILFKGYMPLDVAAILKARGMTGAQPKRFREYPVYHAPEGSFCLVDARSLLLGEETYLLRALETQGSHAPDSAFSAFLEERDRQAGLSALLQLKGIPDQEIVLDKLPLGKLLNTVRRGAEWLTLESHWGPRVNGRLTLRGGPQSKLDMDAVLKSFQDPQNAPVDKASLPKAIQEKQNWESTEASASFAFDVHPALILPPLLEVACPAGYWSTVLQTRDHPRSLAARGEVLRRKTAAAPYLVRGLRTADVFGRRVCAETLGETGAPADKIVPHLLQHAQHQDLELRAAVLEAACRLDSRSPVVHLALLLSFAEAHARLKRVVSECLPKCSPLTKNELPTLCAMLNAGNADLCRQVLGSLGDIGARCRAEGRVPEILLKGLLEALDRNQKTGPEVAKALKQIRPFVPDDWLILESALKKKQAEHSKKYILTSMCEDGLHPPQAFATIAEIAKAPAWSFRMQAIEVLAHFSPTKEQLRVVLGALTDPHEQVRVQAVKAVGHLGEHAHEAVPHLIDLAASEEAKLSVAAIEALARIGDLARLARPRLMDLAGKTSNADIQGAARAAISRIGVPTAADVDSLVAILKSTNPHRADAARLLLELGQEGKAATAALIVALQDTNRTVRLLCVLALERIKARDAIVPLAKLLNDAEKEVRLQALVALDGFGAEAEPVVSFIAAAVKDADPFVRRRALKTLAPLAKTSTIARVGLLDVMKAEESEDRQMAAKTLQGVKGPAVPGLTKLLAEKRAEVRLLAVQTLATIGAEAAPAAPALLELLEKEENKEVRLSMIGALGRLGTEGKAAIPVLAKLLSEDDKSTRLEVVKALSGFGPLAKPVAGDVAAVLRTGDKDLYLEAATTLRALKLETKEVVKYLIGAFRNSDVAVRLQITQDIKKIGKAAIFPLQQQLDHQQAAVRLGVVMTMAEFGTEAGSCMRLLRKRLEVETEPTVHKEIVRAMNAINGS